MGSIFGKAKRGFGKALRPKGPGVLRPKPTDRYGQTLKPNQLDLVKKMVVCQKQTKKDNVEYLKLSKNKEIKDQLLIQGKEGQEKN